MAVATAQSVRVTFSNRTSSCWSLLLPVCCTSETRSALLLAHENTHDQRWRCIAAANSRATTATAPAGPLFIGRRAGATGVRRRYDRRRRQRAPAQQTSGSGRLGGSRLHALAWASFTSTSVSYDRRRVARDDRRAELIAGSQLAIRTTRPSLIISTPRLSNSDWVKRRRTRRSPNHHRRCGRAYHHRLANVSDSDRVIVVFVVTVAVALHSWLQLLRGHLLTVDLETKVVRHDVYVCPVWSRTTRLLPSTASTSKLRTSMAVLV